MATAPEPRRFRHFGSAKHARQRCKLVPNEGRLRGTRLHACRTASTRSSRGASQAGSNPGRASEMRDTTRGAAGVAGVRKGQRSPGKRHMPATGPIKRCDLRVPSSPDDTPGPTIAGCTLTSPGSAPMAQARGVSSRRRCIPGGRLFLAPPACLPGTESLSTLPCGDQRVKRLYCAFPPLVGTLPST